MKKIVKSLLVFINVLILGLLSQTVISNCAENELLKIDDTSLVSAGAEKFWDGFGYSYEYKNLIYRMEDNNTLLLYDCNEKAKGTVVVPSKLFGFNVKFGSDEDGLSYPIFEGCNKIEKVIVSKGIKLIGSGAFENCSSIKEIVLPDGVENIMPYAFYGCTSLKKLNIPDSIREISCYILNESYIYKDKKNWKNGGLYWDSCLLSVEQNFKGVFVVKKGTKAIASYAFDDATKIKEIVLPDSVISISSVLSINPSGARKINIPKNVEYIGECFFAGNRLEYIDVHDENKYFCDIDGSLLTKDKKKYLRNAIGNDSDEFGNYSIPEGVEYIATYAFCYAGYREIIIPKTTKTLGKLCFDYCSIEEITVPATVKKVEYGIFRNCRNLKKVDFQCELKTIGESMFEACCSLEKIIIPEGVEKIGNYAFEGCELLESVTLPSTLKEISSTYVFKGCINLKSIKVHEDNKCFSVEDNILYDKNITRVIKCPAAYSGKNVVLPDSVGKIGKGAFMDCRNIEYVKIPSGVECISESSFAGCENLKSINMPGTVKGIEFFSFLGCNKLDITIPVSVKKINSEAFGYTNEREKIKGYIVKGYKGTEAEAYAKDNGFKFQSVGTVGKNYDATFSYSMADQLKWLPSRAFMIESTIYLLDSIKGETVTELIYCSNYMLYDYNTVPIEDDSYIGTGSQFIVFPHDQDRIEEFYFVKMGDANGNGVIDKNDVKIAKKYKGKIVKNNDFPMMAIDFDFDKKITEKDIVNLKNVLNNKTTTEMVITQNTCLFGGKNHTEVTLKAVAPTYTQTGLTEGKKCSVCGKVTKAQKTVAKKKLKKATLSSVKSTKATTAAVTWKKVADATGYIVEYSTSKKFTKKTTKKVTIKKGKTTKNTLKKLKSGTKYYVRIKAYKTVNKKTVYGAYSAVKNVKVK